MLLFLRPLGYLRNTRDSFFYLLQHQGKYGSHPPLPGFSQMSEEPVSVLEGYFLKIKQNYDPFLQENTWTFYTYTCEFQGVSEASSGVMISAVTLTVSITTLGMSTREFLDVLTGGRRATPNVSSTVPQVEIPD